MVVVYQQKCLGAPVAPPPALGVAVYATDCDNVKFRLPVRRHRLSAAYAARLPAVGGKITA
jgi:hypothetical protein